MATTPVLIQGVSDAIAAQNASFVGLKTVVANATNGPITSIQSRAPMTDLTQDLGVRFGVNRSIFMPVAQVIGEYGPNGEEVYKPQNDLFNQVRIVGPWSVLNNANTGAYISGTGSSKNYVEVTFYGTGLNLLMIVDASNRNFTVGIDGGAQGSNLYPSNNSGVLDNRNYATYQILNVASGLSLGVHTAKIVDIGGLDLYGFEILNTNSTLQYLPGSNYAGGKKLTATALTTDSYNSGFQSGSLNATYGGNVVVYQNANGQIQKAIQSNSTTLYYPSANHTNESVIKVYDWREFGASRDAAQAGTANNADFTGLATTTTSASFTLDDGSTTLRASGVSAGVTQSYDNLEITGSAGSFYELQFIGTGVDLVVGSSTGTVTTHQIYVDGVLQVSSFTTTPIAGAFAKVAIASGLPYGQHTVQVVLNATVAAAMATKQFVVYGPSKPSIPAGAVEIGNYYLLGSWSAAPNASYNQSGTVPQGIILKQNIREWVYGNTSGATGVTVGPSPGGGTSPASFWSGYRINLVNSNDYAQYTFFGSQCDLFIEGNGSGVTGIVKVDGVQYAAANNTAGIVGTGLTWGGGSFNTLTWSSAQQDIVTISGLSLGLHTIQVIKSASLGNLLVDSIGIVTPVHSPKSNVPGDYQSTLSVGSQAIGDSRNFGANQIKASNNWVQVQGVTSDPTTTSTSFVPCPDMTAVIKTAGNPIQLFYSIDSYNAATGINNEFAIYVDNVPIPNAVRIMASPGATFDMCTSDSWIIPVAAGMHVVQIFWLTTNAADAATARNAKRDMWVREIGT